MSHKFSLLIILLVMSCSKKEHDVTNILSKNMAANTISYLLKTQNKALFEHDTISPSYNIEIKINNDDTIYGYDFMIKKTSNDYLVYHYNNITYQIDSLNSRIVTSNKKKDFYQQMILPLVSFDINDSVISTQIENKNIIITKNLGDFDEVKNVVWNYIISIDEQQIIKKTSYVEFQNTNQYNSWEFKNIKYLNQTNIKNEIENLEKVFKVISFSELVNKKDKVDPIPNIASSNLLGVNLKDMSSFNLNEVTDKYILLDFWFMACYPCIKSFPFLNDLNKKFNNEGLQIIGVNLKDYDENKFNILKNYVNDKNINYNIVLNKDNPFKIESFPTLILLNEHREIIYSHIGYSESNEKKLDSIINNLEF